MTLRVQSVSFDSHDPSGTAEFWEQTLAWRRTFEDDDEVVLEPPAGSREDGVASSRPRRVAAGSRGDPSSGHTRVGTSFLFASPRPI
jgi:hypothetical protein